MSDFDTYFSPMTIGGGLAALAVAVSKAMSLWATIRREEIDAVRVTAKEARDAQAERDKRELGAMDRIADEVRAHTTTDIAHHNNVLQAVTRLEVKLSTRLPDPPSERRRKQTPTHAG